MRKEYILTEEEKTRKRQRIEENRYDGTKTVPGLKIWIYIYIKIT